jgi:hypothetical protein
VAGICGTPGFLDGPLGYNQLSRPTNLGVSREGVVYFFDSGNEYMRIVAVNGEVSTLLLGACKECTVLYMQWMEVDCWVALSYGRLPATRTGLKE